MSEEVNNVPYCLNERPEGMDYEAYKLIRKLQRKMRDVYLNDPRRFQQIVESELKKTK